MAIEAKATLLKRIENGLADKLTARDLSVALEEIANQLNAFDVVQTEHTSGTDDMLDAFISAKSIEGRSEKTLARYQYLIKRLMRFANVPTHEITVYHIRHFLGEEKKRGQKDSTLEATRQVYCAYFNWLHREGLLATNPSANLGTIKCEKKIVETYTDVELELLKGGCRNVREKALVMFLAASGCRVGEVASLNRDSIDLNNSMCKVHGKGNKERYVYFDSVTAMVLEKYMDSRVDDEPALFINRFGKRIKTGGILFVLKEIGFRAGVQNVYAHKFRRTCATKLIARGMSIENVAHILGHAKLETSMRYVKLDDRAIHSRYNVCA